MRAAVWYRREPIFFRTDDSLTMEKLPETHIQVCIIEDARSKEEVFGQMQGEVWSPKGEARSLIKALGLKRTSMS